MSEPEDNKPVLTHAGVPVLRNAEPLSRFTPDPGDVTGWTPLQGARGETGRMAREQRELRERLDAEGVPRKGRVIDDAILAIRKYKALAVAQQETARVYELRAGEPSIDRARLLHLRGVILGPGSLITRMRRAAKILRWVREC